MKSHTALRTLLVPDAPVRDFIGNWLADAVCGEAAEGACVSSAATPIIEQWCARTVLICKRIAILEASAWTQGPTLCDSPDALAPFEPPVWANVMQDIESLISDKGHVLRLEGGWVRCGRCHRKRRPRAAHFWLRTPCVGAHKDTKRSRTAAASAATACATGVQPPRAPSLSLLNIDDPEGDLIEEDVEEDMCQELPQDEGVKVAIEIRRSLLEKSRIEQRRRTRVLQGVHQAIWRARAHQAATAPDFADLGETVVAPPFYTDPSHRLIVCGGYAGCTRCASVNGFGSGGKLAQPCRGSYPQGSALPLQRLAKGLPPREDRAHVAWPSGESEPTPKRLRL